MRKYFRLHQYFLILTALLISSKSFAADCPSNGITSSTTCSGDILGTANQFRRSRNVINLPISQSIGGRDSSGNSVNQNSSTSNLVNMTGNISITFDGTEFDSVRGLGLQNSNAINNANVSFSTYTNNLINTNTVNLIGNISMFTSVSSFVNAIGINLSNDNTIGQRYGSTNNTNTNTNTNINIVNMIGNISITGSGSRNYGISLSNSNTIGDYGSYYSINTNNNNDTNVVNLSGNILITTSDSFAINLANNSIYNSAYGSNDNTDSNISSGTNIANVTGRISATGANSYAIYATNNSSTSSNTVQLNKGSSIIGGIFGEGDFLANNFLKLNLGAGASYDFVTEGFTVTDLNGRPMVTGSAHAAGIGNVSTASQSLYERTSQVTQSLDDRLRTHDLKQNTDQPYWINTYYSDSSRDGQGLSGSNLSFNQYRSGITAGFNVKNSYTPTELIMNYEHGQLNIDEGNQGISSNSVMAGALFPDIKKLFTGTLSAKAMVGYSDFSGDRKVLTNVVAFNGSRNVTASYQSTHLTLGSAWTKTLYQTDKITLDTLVGIDLNTQHINSYSESDLFKWNGRTINQLQERVTLGMEMKPLVKPLTLFGRVGIERRDLLSGENQNYTINNTGVSYNDSNQRNTYATLNAGAYYPLTPTVKAYAQVRYYDSVKDIDSLSGSIGISGQF